MSIVSHPVEITGKGALGWFQAKLSSVGLSVLKLLTKFRRWIGDDGGSSRG